ncbi:protein TIFY 3-like [Aristolochia californica]|uniref:protein TIFY 3-like n=1 Tax=Aristolochia californica TaxID=171875 RepID=UPI0035E0D542
MDGNQWGKNKDCASYRLSSISDNGTEAASRSSKRIMSRNVSLFKKYLFDKAHQNVSNADVRETDQIMRTQPVCGALLPYQDHEFRMPSLLERELVVGIKSGRQPPSIQSRKAQLTIFYAGTVNVYDNVPVDKAQAIMLLAGGTSSTKPATSRVNATAATARRVTPAREIPSVCEVGADVPRKQSLHRFLEKRRDRIIKVAPYFSIKKEVDEATMTNCLEGDRSD